MEEEGRPDGEVWRWMMDIPAMCEDEEMALDEGMVEEVMRRLEEEISHHHHQHPSAAADDDFDVDAQDELFEEGVVVAPSSIQLSPFVTINGNEESCGPSFSDSASTVMASIDTRGVVGLGLSLNPGGAFHEHYLSQKPQEAAAGGGEWEGADGEWLARVLSGAELEAEV